MGTKGNSGSFKPGDRRAGRPKGTPNRATADVRMAMAQLAEGNIERVQKWLDRVARKDPARALDLFLRLLEYYIPKLQRSEFTGKDGKDLLGLVLLPAKDGLATR